MESPRDYCHSDPSERLTVNTDAKNSNNKNYEYAQPRICPEKRETKTSLTFRDTNGSPNLSQTTRSNDSKQQKNLPNCGHCSSG